MKPSVIVLAKAPTAGRVKTRLCPPCDGRQAAALAEAALVDTLDVVRRVQGVRPVLALAGAPGAWLPAGIEVVAQRGRALGERLGAAFVDVGGPAVLVGMDTPQLTGDLVGLALRRLGCADAVLGLARDGGWWAIGLQEADPRVFDGVPMSTARTGRDQVARLETLRLRTAHLPVLRDVDRFDDALAVAAEVPHTRFAEQLGAIVRSQSVRTPAAVS
jgi:rSAM/selenodomain-associated transferase 1